MEADANAVVVLDAKFEAFATMMLKITKLNGQLINKKSPESYLIAAAAHPVAVDRISSVKMRMERKENKKSLFNFSEYFSDVYSGPFRYPACICLLLLILGTVSFANYTLSRHMFIDSIKRDSVEDITARIDQGADVNGVDVFMSGGTPLITAIVHQRPDIVSLLLSRGANSNYRLPNEHSPLAFAVIKNDKNIVRQLVAAGANPLGKSYLGNQFGRKNT